MTPYGVTLSQGPRSRDRGLFLLNFVLLCFRGGKQHPGVIFMTYSWWRHQMETFPRYWPFVRGIRRSPVNSPHKGQWRGALMFLICTWTNDLSKQSRRRWFETPLCSLQHQCNVVLEIRWTMRSQITPNKLPIGYHHHYGHNHHLRIYNLTKTHSGRSPGVVIHTLGLSWIRLSRDVFY